MEPLRVHRHPWNILAHTDWSFQRFTASRRPGSPGEFTRFSQAVLAFRTLFFQNSGEPIAR